MEEKFLDLIKKEDLPEPYKQIAKIGIEGIIEIAKVFGGTYQYFPKLDSIVKPARDKMIQEEFNGYNYDELAIKYNLSAQWVRMIVAPIEKQVRLKPYNGQMSLLND